MISEIVFLIKAFWLIVIGFIKTMQSFLECLADVWNRFVVPSPRSAVYASAVPMDQPEITFWLIIIALIIFLGFFLVHSRPSIPQTEGLEVFRCPACGTTLEEDLEDSSKWNCPKCNYGWFIKSLRKMKK